MQFTHTEATKFKIKPFVSGSECNCADKLCVRKINVGESCYLDLLSDGDMLCKGCGQALRYARKKAHQRGEPIETAEV